MPSEATTILSGGTPPENLFDRFAWFYAFCRERLFRDDTGQIVATLWPGGCPTPGSHLLEIGCGPGFYATRLAARFPLLHVTGLDRSTKLLEHSAARARLMDWATAASSVTTSMHSTALRNPRMPWWFRGSS